MSAISGTTDMIPTGGPQGIQASQAGAGGAPVTGMGAAEVWRIVKQRKLFISLMTIFFYTLVVVGTIVVAKWFPQYTSLGIFEVAPQRTEIFAIEPNTLDPDSVKLELESEARKMTNLAVLTDVVATAEFQSTHFWKWYNRDIGKCVYDLQRMVSATPIPDTNLIRVSLSCQYKTEARDIVNTVMRRYETLYREHAVGYYRAQVESVQTSLGERLKKLDQQQIKMTQFRENIDVPQVETERSATTQTLTFFAQEIAQYEANEAQLASQLRAVRAWGAKLPLTPEMKIILESDPRIRLYRSQAETLEIEMNTAAAILLGENHRTMRLLDERRRGYQEFEASQREQLIQDLRNREVSSLEQALSATRNVMVSLQEDLAETEARQRDLDKFLQRYATMVSEEDRMQEQLIQLEKLLSEAQHAYSDSSRVRLRVVQDAQLPIWPSRPSWALYLIGGGMLSVMSAAGLAFLREFTDTAVRTPVDVARSGRVSVLGSVPILDDEEASIEEIEMATRSAPQSLVAEAFRQIRTNLLFSSPPEAQRSLLITSPSPGDGKSAISINLAVSMARGGQRVLLIDANFRRPSLRSAFPNTNSDGLSNILVGQTTLEKTVSKTDIPNLDILTTGPMPPTPAELLATRYMRELLEAALKSYDRVLIDGPPILLMSDALMLATMVDGVVITTRAVSNSKGALRRARDQLAGVNARVLGAILNCVQTRAGGYFKRQYREFYDYTSDETIPPELPMSRAEEGSQSDDQDE